MRRPAVWVLATLGLIAVSVLVLRSGILVIRGEELVIDNEEVTLAATLALPRWREGPFPAAVIVHGSGAVTRRELRGYARKLVPQGLAVLMYDKRGVGQSTGSYRAIGAADSEVELGRLADDAVAAVRYLGKRADIDASRIGLIGGSQAGWIMPLAASRCEAVAFIVSISGPAVTYGQEIHYSQLTGDDPGPYQDLSGEEIHRRFAAFGGPQGYDPLPVLERLAPPSLWLLGLRDRSVPTERSLANLREIMARRPGGFDVRVYPEGDHSLRDARSGRRIDYWADVRRWLTERGILEP